MKLNFLWWDKSVWLLRTDWRFPVLEKTRQLGFEDGCIRHSNSVFHLYLIMHWIYEQLIKLKEWYGGKQKAYSVTRKMRDSFLPIGSLHSQYIIRRLSNDDVDIVYLYTRIQLQPNTILWRIDPGQWRECGAVQCSAVQCSTVGWAVRSDDANVQSDSDLWTVV
jgi:hypothetical protein